MFCSSLNINHSKFNYNNIIIIKKNLLPLLFAIIVHAIIFATLIDNYQQPLIVNLQKIQVNFAQNTQINNSKLDTNNAIKQKETNNFVDKKNIQQNASELTKESINKTSQDTQNSIQDSISSSSSKNQVADSNIITSPVFDAQYLNNPSPIYPSNAKNNNIQGKVFLSVLVGIEGRAIEVKIANSSGYSILDNSALSAVRKWQFVPAKKNGEAVPATVIVPVEFKIV